MSEKMLVTQALDERDLLVKKINDSSMVRATLKEVFVAGSSPVCKRKHCKKEERSILNREISPSNLHPSNMRILNGY